MYFVIRPDADQWDNLILKRGENLDAITRIHGQRIGPAWVPLEVERFPARFPPCRGKPVDFPSFIGIDLVMSPRAFRVIDPLVGRAMEALPLVCDGQYFYAGNLLDRIDCLDLSRAVVRRARHGMVVGVDRYAFRPGVLDGRHLFKVAGTIAGDVLVSEQFKRRVDEMGLVGLKFAAAENDDPSP